MDRKGSKVVRVEHQRGLSVIEWRDLHNAALLHSRLLHCETEREVEQLRDVSSK